MATAERPIPQAALVQKQLGVGCVVLREHAVEPVLLLRRAFGEFAGKWCFVAGHVEAGEDPAEAARRELREETHLTPSSVRELLVHNLPDVELHVFVAQVAHSSPRIRLDSEHSEFGWFSYADALRLLPLEAQRSVLHEVLAS